MLEGMEQIQFGVPDGYEIHFTRGGDELQRLMNKPVAQDTSRPAAGQQGTTNLEKLRAVLEVGRSLQSSFSTDDVLNTVVERHAGGHGCRTQIPLLSDARSSRTAGSQRGPAGRRSSSGRSACPAAVDPAGAREPQGSVFDVVRSAGRGWKIAGEHDRRSRTAQCRGVPLVRGGKSERVERRWCWRRRPTRACSTWIRA